MLNENETKETARRQSAPGMTITQLLDILGAYADRSPDASVSILQFDEQECREVEAHLDTVQVSISGDGHVWKVVLIPGVVFYLSAGVAPERRSKADATGAGSEEIGVEPSDGYRCQRVWFWWFAWPTFLWWSL